jgi:hypothetical protein
MVGIEEKSVAGGLGLNESVSVRFGSRRGGGKKERVGDGREKAGVCGFDHLAKLANGGRCASVCFHLR